jgi:16S rRNA processing protein RimM
MTETVEVIVGVVGRPHGVRGDVLVELRTDEPERRFRPGAVLRSESGDRRLTVSARRSHADRLIVSFADIADRAAAEALRGIRLVVDVAAGESPAEPEEFYDRQLIGLAVFDAAGQRVGQVMAVLHPPGQDLLEIHTESGPRLVPFATALVPEVDLAAQTIRLADVSGLLDEEAG